MPPQVAEEPRSSPLAPGAVSALLRDLARAPADPAGRVPALRPGQVVGRFELVREIGRGGFGVVFEARDLELGRPVAFKALRAHGVTAVDERLLHEAEAAARLSHPNIVTLFDVGRCEQGAFLVLELLRGVTVAERLADGELPEGEGLRIGTEVAKGLAHAHARGVVHRDLSPRNVFLCEDGHVKVLDLGLAFRFGRRKVDGGTPAYMAPEQRRGAPEDERTDVYALGLLLREMGVRGDPALADLVRRMLSDDPVARPRDAGEVLAALTGASGGAGVGAAAPPRARGRSRRAALLLVGGALAAAAVGLGVLERRARAPAPTADGRHVVAVADFVNETKDPELDGLSVMLITSLEQSRRLAVLTRSRMVDVARSFSKDADRIDETLGRAVAARAGARTLLLATVHRFEDVYAVDLLAVDPARSEYLFTLSDKGRGKASVPGIIDRLSARARLRLREPAGEVEAARIDLAQATTVSFEAFGHYVRGQRLADDPPAAMSEFQKAVALDPGFALAHCWIAYYGELVGLPQPARAAALRAALARVDRLPDKERRLVLAWKAQIDGREEEAAELYRRAAERYPDDKVVHFFAGDLLFHAGRSGQAAPWFERAFELDPRWAPTLAHLPLAFEAANRSSDLLARAERWAAAEPSAAAHRLHGAALVAVGRWTEAAEALRRALAADGSEESRRQLAAVLVLLDRPREAERVAREGAAGFALPDALAYEGRYREARAALESIGGAGNRAASYRARRLALLAGEGEAAAARAEAAALAAAGLRPDRAAVLLAVAGDLDGAGAQAAKLAATSDLRLLVDALTALRRGRRDAAHELLWHLSRSREADCAAVASLALGERALEDGQPDDAAAALEGVGAASAVFMAVDGTGAYRSWAYPRSLYLAAAARHALGQEAQAREHLDRLLALWQRADPELPLLRRARGLERELERGGGARR